MENSVEAGQSNVKHHEAEKQSLLTNDIMLDTKVSWFVSICSSLANIIVLGSLLSYAVLFPKLLEEFQEGKAKTGKLTLSAIALIVTIFCCILYLISTA